MSLADSLDGDDDGSSLSLMDVIAVDDNMLEELDTRDACRKVRHCVATCLTDRERSISSPCATAWMTALPEHSGRSPPAAASAGPMYRALRSGRWRSWNRLCGSKGVGMQGENVKNGMMQILHHYIEKKEK